MAQPLAYHPTPAVTAPQNEALASAYELLELLHEKGVLDLLRGMVGAGDRLTTVLAAAMDTPAAIGGMRNFLLLTKFFSCIPSDVLDSLVATVQAGAAREKSHKAPGLLQLLWRLRKENSRHAVAVGLDLLEGIGKGL